MPDAPKRRHAARVRAVLADSSAAARSAVAASWIRSATWYGLSPEASKGPRTLSANELRQTQQEIEPLLRAAQPHLDRLFQAVGSNGCCVLFTDRHGVPIDRRGVGGDDQVFRDWGLWTGAVWSEESEGTNGIGTCLAEGRALTIHGEEHFHARNTALSRTVAPIYDDQGRLAAALDVSSCRADAAEGLIGLIAAAVTDAARRIETDHFRGAYPTARLLAVGHTKRGDGLLAVDRDDMVIGATRGARLIYGLTDARLAGAIHVDELLFPEAELSEDLVHLERSAMQRALARTSGNVSAAARALGISRATMHRKLSRLGMTHRS